LLDVEVYCIGDAVYQVGTRAIMRATGVLCCALTVGLCCVVLCYVQEDDICRTLYIVASGTVQLVWPEKDNEGVHKVSRVAHETETWFGLRCLSVVYYFYRLEKRSVALGRL
jgi:hypothetical protein